MRGNFRPLISKIFKCETTFSITFPKDSEALNILDIRLQEVGAKRRLNGTSKSEHTHRQTHRQTYRHFDL